MKGKRDIYLGVGLLGLGIITANTYFRVITISIKQGWTFALIIPCILEIQKNGMNRINLMGLGIGLSFFLSAQFPALTELLWPIILVVIGLSFLLVPSKTD